MNGQIYYRENSRMNPVEVSKTAESRIRGMIELRDCVRTLLEYQTEDYPDEEIKAQQAKLNALYETYIDIANWGRILHQNVNKELSHMFVERLQLSPKERYEQFNRRYPGLINRVKLKYVAAFLGISIYTLSRVRAKK